MLDGIKKNGTTMSINNFTDIKESLISESFGFEIYDYLNDFKKYPNQKFNNLVLHIFEEGMFMLELSEKSEMENIINGIKNNFEMEGNYFSKELENNRQVPELAGYFEYNGKYYVLISPLNKNTDEINPEKGIYKGVIIEPDKYFEAGNEVQKVVSKVDKIID